LARRVFGGDSLLYYFVQAMTMLILVLAANTSFADFPRLSSFMARDGFMPRQFSNRGDRLAFSNGIIILAFLSAILLVLFRADTHALIPLYAIGVFVSFTLSQSGMVRYWLRERGPRWFMRATVNGAGAAATGIVTLIIATTKFTHGAWIVIVLIPLLKGQAAFDHGRPARVHPAAMVAAPSLQSDRPPDEGGPPVPEGGRRNGRALSPRGLNVVSQKKKTPRFRAEPRGLIGVGDQN